MKKLFKEHDLVKIISIMLFLVIVLSWIIPTGSFSTGGSFVEGDMGRIGLAHIFYGFSYAMQNYTIQIGFLLMVGIFYGVISKTEGYKELVHRIAKFGEKREIVVSLVVSFLVAILASTLNNTLVLIAFMPFLVTVLRKMGLSKISAFASTFGSILVGVLGATIGTEGLDSFILYIGYGGSEVTLLTELGIRIGIFALAFILYSFFNVMYIKKTIGQKNQEEEKDDAFSVEDPKKKKGTKIWPTVLMLAIVFIFGILGFVYWNESQSGTTVFGLEIFDNFFEWLNGLEIGEVPVIQAIFGGGGSLPYMTADLVPVFGEWYLFTYSIVLAIVTIIIKFISRMQLNDMLTYAWDGMKKVIKPILFLVLAYMVFVFLYWSPFMATIINQVGLLSSSFNPLVVSLQAFINSLFNSDFAYIGYSMSYSIASYAGTEGNIAFLIYTTIYGLVQFITPISVFLLFGLSYMNIPYKKWMGYIWKFFLGMLVCLLVIFALLTYL